MFTTPHTNKCTWEETLNNIKEVGPSSTIVATDLGQTTNPGLQEGFEIFIEKLLDAGLQRGAGEDDDAAQRGGAPRR